MVTASLNNYRQSPRKVRVVADAVRGKSVLEAISILTFIPKRASLPIKKLIDSAVANAENNFKLDRKNLFIKEIAVNAGFVLKRSMPAARGSAHPIKKRSSKVSVILAERVVKEVKAKPAKKAKTATKAK